MPATTFAPSIAVSTPFRQVDRDHRGQPRQAQPADPLIRNRSDSSRRVPASKERSLDPSQHSRFRKPLIRWYEAHARDLPWRRTNDPYRVWISEIMLQQTTVVAVIPYFERFLKRFPTVKDLAQAEESEVLKLWEGLGYYSRARNIHKAAGIVTDQFDGVFPSTVAELQQLPGIGRYTAGAVSSIAFNQPRPVLDGNVIRVLTRIFGIAENPREAKTNARLWLLAENLVGRAKNAKPAKENSAAPASRPSRDADVFAI